MGLIDSADAIKSQGTKNTKFGKYTKNIVCGDILCSEKKQTNKFTFGGTIEKESKITICHIAPGSEKAMTLEINESALDAHKAHHGDMLGSCDSPISKLDSLESTTQQTQATQQTQDAQQTQQAVPQTQATQQTNTKLVKPVPQSEIKPSTEKQPEKLDLKDASEKDKSANLLLKDNLKNAKIPDWVRNNAGWWAQDMITDKDFSKGIEFLVKEKIIIVEIPQTSDSADSVVIPKWIKNNAEWWSEYLITDDNFASGIEWLIKNKIISVF